MRFVRVGGDSVEKDITSEMSVREALSVAGVAHKKDDEVRISGTRVDLDSKIAPNEVKFVTVIPKINGG